MHVATPLRRNPQKYAETPKQRPQAKTPSKNAPLIKGEGEYAAKPRKQGAA